MKLLTALLSLLLAHTSVVLAQDPIKDGAHTEHFDLARDGDRKLFAFCQISLLQQRGISCSPFIGNTDKWILERLLPRREFIEALKATKRPPKLMRPTSGESKVNDSAPPDSIDAYQRNDRYTAKLLESLTPEQQDKLPLIYLHIEGFMALCRPEFASLFEREGVQAEIHKIASEMSSEANEIHRALFGLKSLDEAPFLELQLRQLAFRLDCRITGILNDVERQKVVDTLAENSKLRRWVYGGPAY